MRRVLAVGEAWIPENKKFASAVAAGSAACACALGALYLLR